MKDLTNLRKIAEVATPGPWEPYDANEGMDRAYSPMWCVANEEFHNPTTGDDEDWMGVEIHVGDKADSDHIATFDPPTILALLTRLEQAEAAVARVREVLEHHTFVADDKYGDLPASQYYGDSELEAVAAKSIIRALDGEQG